MIPAERIWHALDTLAQERGMTPSGLARAAGLDATTFNPSRRQTGNGVWRWPALPSLLRALDVLRVSLAQFEAKAWGYAPSDTAAESHTPRFMRCLPLSWLQQEGVLDSAGLPAGGLWEQEETFFTLSSPSAYMLRVDTESMEPTLRLGCSLVVQPALCPRGADRVVLIRPGHPPVVGILQEKPVPAIQPFGRSALEPVPAPEVGIWLHRIVLISG
ncbi:transcriptional regulator [Acetobacter aceti 1023]|nr:transcriptional regulator [Acetobacter aceti 1023]